MFLAPWLHNQSPPPCRMFIRRTTIKSRRHAEPYYTYRLAESERVGARMKPRILLNLGRHFEAPKREWRALSSRIEQLLDSQPSLLALELPAEHEAFAQRYAAQIQARRGEKDAAPGGADSKTTFQSDSLSWSVRTQ